MEAYKGPLAVAISDRGLKHFVAPSGRPRSRKAGGANPLRQQEESCIWCAVRSLAHVPGCLTLARLSDVNCSIKGRNVCEQLK